MKKSFIVPVVIAALLALSVGAYTWFLVAGGSEETAKVNDNTPREEQPGGLDRANAATEGPAKGEYLAYDQKGFEARAGRKVLFFHAPWCPQCRQIDSEFTKAKDQSRLPAKLTIYKIDYDSHQGLRQKYGVTLQTTFIAVGSSGDLIKKYVAYDEPTFESVNKNFFDKI